MMHTHVSMNMCMHAQPCRTCLDKTAYVGQQQPLHGMQVDDCIAKYLWMQTMVQKMAERKKQGLPMPASISEVEDQMGTLSAAAYSSCHL